MMRFATIWLAAFSFVAGTLAEAQQIPHNQSQPPGPALSPEEALAKMKVPEGFSVEIVAAEPQIVNPVAMTFDERGRIWITESLEYPRHAPGPGRDRVKILEDSDRDGRVDKVTVFMEGLNIPSGIAVGYGGAWVANAPDILFVQDTDGDGKADKQEVVVTGFGRNDTHELPNSLTWGPDGWLYGLNGVFNHSHVKYPAGSPLAEKRPQGFQFTCAMFRIHPRTREFQVFAEGTSNPWGIAFDNEGSAFVSACVIDHLWHIVETGYYHRQAGAYPPYTWKIESIVKHKHQKAAYCGLHFFDSDAYPEQYREKLYMGNIHGNCINVDKLARDGSTYFATGEPDFLSANDAWFMPVAQKTGPDGCLYVLDWYDQYHCYQDANRDPAGIERAKGRLYRVRYKDTPRAPAFDLAKESDDQLIERLKSQNVYFRDAAQRVLAERDARSSVPGLLQMASDKSASRKTRLHALFAVAGMGSATDAVVTATRDSDDSTIRAWGVRLAFDNPKYRENLGDRLFEMMQRRLSPEASPEVLLQLAIGVSKMPHDDQTSQVVLLELLKLLESSGDDPLIQRIIWKNLHPLLENHAAILVKLLRQSVSNDRRYLESKSVAALLPRAAERIIGSAKPDVQAVAGILSLLASQEPSGLRQCLALLAEKVQNGEIAGDMLDQLRRQLASTVASRLQRDATDPARLDAAILAASWGDQTAVDSVRPALIATNSPAAARLRALGALIAARDAGLFDILPGLLTTRFQRTPADGRLTDTDFRGQVIASLGKFDDPRVGDVLLSVYKQLPVDVQSAAINTLTQRAVWAKQLLAAIGRKEIPDAALNVNQARKLLASRDAELTAAVNKLWGTVREERNPRRDAVIAEMRGFIRRTPGDAAKGHEVFKKVCGQCHKIYGEGEEVGPDLTLNGRNNYEQLLSNVFDPSLVIGAAYQARTIVTTQGRVVSGLVAEESEQRVVLKIQGGKQEVVPRSNIEEMSTSELSLMPEDLEKTLKAQEIADLFAFITLDKPPTDATARQLPGVRDVLPRETTDPGQYAGIVSEVAPGFTVEKSGQGGVALLRRHAGRAGVLRTHPIDQRTSCVLVRTLDLPAGAKAKLRLSVSHEPGKDWQLIVKANDQKLYDEEISQQSTENGWAELAIDLSKFAGQTVRLELHNHPDDWDGEFAYWGHVEVGVE